MSDKTFKAVSRSSALICMLPACAILFAQVAQAQDQIPGITRQPSEAAADVLLDPNDVVVLLLDHQTGLFQTVKDIPVDDLRRNTIALAKIATQIEAPVILTAAKPDGPNGPLMSESEEVMPDATYVARQGEVSAWDNARGRRDVAAQKLLSLHPNAKRGGPRFRSLDL